MKFKILLISLLLLTFSYNSYSQCCAAGNPVSADGSVGNAGKKILGISGNYRHSYSDTYYDGTKATDYKYVDNSYYDFSSINLSYGLTDKLTIRGDIGYFFSKTQVLGPPVVPDEYIRKSTGLGDASIALSYTLIKIYDKKFEISPSFAITAPVGKFDVVYNNVLLPIDLQPSSGSFKYKPSVFISKGFSGNKLMLSSLISAEFAQPIQTERTVNYKYGNLYLVSLLASYRFSPKFSTIIQIREQIREKSTDKNKLMNATGGQTTFLIPQINYTPFAKWTISALFEWPLLKNLNGPQLSNKYAFAIILAKKINFCKPPKTEENTEK